MHIKKLVVGFETLNDFARYQEDEANRVRYDGKPANTIHTRNTPKQADEILAAGGSAYRIIKGRMCCHQKILGFETIENAGKKRCIIYLDPQIIETYNTPHRPFQGWRYLKPADIAPDIAPYIIGQKTTDMPAEMQAHLREAGLL